MLDLDAVVALEVMHDSNADDAIEIVEMPAGMRDALVAEVRRLRAALEAAHYCEHVGTEGECERVLPLDPMESARAPQADGEP